ncbi:hypothetical protein RhiirA1_452560 [Rhizophagus irregularis]|uniref:Uncharacterized protein n=1 Tax=Rhizophagus irregularis TaxID=588596 RepID=A0A2N0S9K6_9GLOM|nr:hypothetical protein RhiirA1_452560 [Rhizophagus irregularis]
MRQDRDKWQLVRDLTKEEMEEITKKNNGYDFLKKMQTEYTAAFIKIIKITQGYFSNHKMMENAVELAMSKNDLAKVNVSLSQTPPNRIYMELVNMASRNYKNNLPPVTGNEKEKINLEEKEVVNMIKDWRIREKEEEPESDDSSDNDLGINMMEKSADRPLQRDNIDTDEVVDIIRDYQTDRIVYNSKKEQLKIFEETSNMMEWEHINLQAVMEVKKENGFNIWDVSPKFKNWAMQTNNFLLLEEHRWTDEKEIGEKRPNQIHQRLRLK